MSSAFCFRNKYIYLFAKNYPKNVCMFIHVFMKKIIMGKKLCFDGTVGQPGTSNNLGIKINHKKMSMNRDRGRSPWECLLTEVEEK